MKKKTKRGVSSNRDLNSSSSSDSDANSISRREFGRPVMGTGAAAFFGPAPLTSGVLEVADAAKGDPPPGGTPKPPHLYHRMVSPTIDDLQKPWCFLSHTTTVIGMPRMSEAVHVTYYGAILTRHANSTSFTGIPCSRSCGVRNTGWRAGFQITVIGEHEIEEAHRATAAQVILATRTTISTPRVTFKAHLVFR